MIKAVYDKSYCNGLFFNKLNFVFHAVLKDS